MINRRKSFKRKVYKREVNRLVRCINKTLKEDWLWNGRFHVNQLAAYFHPFEDHSGALYHVILEMVDTKTGRATQQIFDNYDILTKLAWWIDTVIVDEFRIWEENPGPYDVARAAGRKPGGGRS